jgi:hypothetical protein
LDADVLTHHKSVLRAAPTSGVPCPLPPAP